jgi:hypothetical protein
MKLALRKSPQFCLCDGGSGSTFNRSFVGPRRAVAASSLTLGSVEASGTRPWSNLSNSESIAHQVAPAPMFDQRPKRRQQSSERASICERKASMKTVARRRKKAAKSKKAAKCLTCARRAKTRGLCGACYAAMRRDIEAGKTTEEQALADGLVLPASKGGRPKAEWSKKLEQKQRSAKRKSK